MSLRRPVTETELKFFRESVIREYKSKLEERQRNKGMNHVLERLRKIVPLNIAIGLTASALLIFFKGWETLIQLILSSIIWITLTSTIIGAIIGKK